MWIHAYIVVCVTGWTWKCQPITRTHPGWPRKIYGLLCEFLLYNWKKCYKWSILLQERLRKLRDCSLSVNYWFTLLDLHLCLCSTNRIFTVIIRTFSFYFRSNNSIKFKKIETIIVQFISLAWICLRTNLNHARGPPSFLNLWQWLTCCCSACESIRKGESQHMILALFFHW